jgi:ATP-dependent helicase/nuclease subunit A
VTVHEEISDLAEDMQETAQTEQLQKTEVPEYPYELKENVKSKVTVSELKEQLQDEDFEADAMLEDSVKKASGEAQAEEQPDIVPKFMTDGQQELKGNQRGTAYHRIMECLNFGKFAKCSDKEGTLQEIRRQLDEMLESGRITGQQHECVEPKDIQAFVMSDVGARTVAAAQAGKLHREQPFVYIDEDIPEQLVQGVIEMYFEERGVLVIVDYKTDRVSGKDGAKVLKERYSVQLDYYAKALGQITGLAVKEKVIYSFALKESLEI